MKINSVQFATLCSVAILIPATSTHAGTAAIRVEPFQPSENVTSDDAMFVVPSTTSSSGWNPTRIDRSKQADKVVSGHDFSVLQRWSALSRQLNALGQLDKGWDGEDGIPLPKSSLDCVEDLLVELQVSGVDIPQLFAAGDGEVGLRWDWSGRFGSVSIMPDGHLVAFVEGRSGQPALEIDEPYTAQNVQSVILYVNALT